MLERVKRQKSSKGSLSPNSQVVDTKKKYCVQGSSNKTKVQKKKPVSKLLTSDIPDFLNPKSALGRHLQSVINDSKRQIQQDTNNILNFLKTKQTELKKSSSRLHPKQPRCRLPPRSPREELVYHETTRILTEFSRIVTRYQEVNHVELGIHPPVLPQWRTDKRRLEQLNETAFGMSLDILDSHISPGGPVSMELTETQQSRDEITIIADEIMQDARVKDTEQTWGTYAHVTLRRMAGFFAQ